MPMRTKINATVFECPFRSLLPIWITMIMSEMPRTHIDIDSGAPLKHTKPNLMKDSGNVAVG